MPHACGVLSQVPPAQVLGMKLLPEHCAVPSLQLLLQQVPLTQLPFSHWTSAVQAWPLARLSWQVPAWQNAVPMQLACEHGAALPQLQAVLQREAPHE
jgi:hypothetical protein